MRAAHPRRHRLTCGYLLETFTAAGGTYTASTIAYYGSDDSGTGTYWLASPGWSNAGWLGP